MWLNKIIREQIIEEDKKKEEKEECHQNNWFPIKKNETIDLYF